MTEESLTKDIKGIVEKHLKGMVADVEWALLMSIDDYDKTICNAFADKLFQCFQPFIKLKFERSSSQPKE